MYTANSLRRVWKGIVIIMKKSFLQIAFANIISLIVGIVNNFILPSKLSIDAYSNIKTFVLYISYAGILTFGYSDGTYLKYGGKSIQMIDRQDLAKDLFNYILMMFGMSLVTLFVGILTDNLIIISFAFGLLFTDLLGYIRMLYQATGEFGKYSTSMNSEKIVIFLFNMIFLFVYLIDNYIYYVLIQVIIDAIIVIFYLISLERRFNLIKYVSFDKNYYKNNISSGFFLMIGNLSAGIFTGIDRWFVKILMSSESFAYYSYAVSMDTVIGMFLSPFAVIMYNYFCKNTDDNRIRNIKNFITVWGFFLIGAVFPAKWILNNFIPKYIPSIKVMSFIFLGRTLSFVVSSIYVNLYKATKNQSEYTKQMTEMILLSIVLNFVAYKICNNMSSIAVATLVTNAIWLIICELKYRQFRYNWIEVIGIILIVCTYLLSVYYFNEIIGMMLYYFIGVLILFFFWHETFKEGIKQLNELRKRFLK